MQSFLKRYRAYLTDNPERYWFKRKAYGWGWVPVTWQGWLSLVLFLGIFVAIFVPFVSNPEPDIRHVDIFLMEIGAWAVALIGLCCVKSEKPRWQWGIPEKNSRS